MQKKKKKRYVLVQKNLAFILASSQFHQTFSSFLIAQYFAKLINFFASKSQGRRVLAKRWKFWSIKYFPNLSLSVMHFVRRSSFLMEIDFDWYLSLLSLFQSALHISSNLFSSHHKLIESENKQFWWCLFDLKASSLHTTWSHSWNSVLNWGPGHQNLSLSFLPAWSRT